MYQYLVVGVMCGEQIGGHTDSHSDYKAQRSAGRAHFLGNKS